MTGATIHEIVKRQRGRTPMAKQNRRFMQIRLSIDEQTAILDSLEAARNKIIAIDGDVRAIDVLIERVAALK